MDDMVKRADALAAIEGLRNDWIICGPCIDEALAAINALPAVTVTDEVADLKQQIADLERQLEAAEHALQYPGGYA